MKKHPLLLWSITSFFGTYTIESSLPLSSSIQESMGIEKQPTDIQGFITKLLPGHPIDITSLSEVCKNRLTQSIEGVIALDKCHLEIQKKIDSMSASETDREEWKQARKISTQEKEAIKKLLLSISGHLITESKNEIREQTCQHIKSAYEIMTAWTEDNESLMSSGKCTPDASPTLISIDDQPVLTEKEFNREQALGTSLDESLDLLSAALDEYIS